MILDPNYQLDTVCSLVLEHQAENLVMASDCLRMFVPGPRNLWMPLHESEV